MEYEGKIYESSGFHSATIEAEDLSVLRKWLKLEMSDNNYADIYQAGIKIATIRKS